MNDSMKAELNALLGDVLTTPMNSKAASLYVLLDGIRYVFEPLENLFQIEEVTLLFKLKPPVKGALNEFEKVWPLLAVRGPIGRLDPHGHILQRVDKLTPVLNLIERDPADEIFMVTWDHGSAFGIFREEIPATPDSKINPMVRIPIYNQPDKYPYLKIFWDRALAEGPFASFMERKKTEKPAISLQYGHTVYTVRAHDEGRALFVDLLQEERVSSLFLLKFMEDQTILEFDRDYYNSISAAEQEALLSGEQKARLEQQLHGATAPAVSIGDGAAPEILKNRELSAVIKSWLGKEGGKVGVLLMMNCWMMNLHTLYSMKDCVKHLVAPQGNIDTPGYNYREILLSIYEANPGPIDVAKLAENTVTLSHNAFIKDRAKLLNPNIPETIDYRVILNMQLDFPQQPTLFDGLLSDLSIMVNLVSQALAQAPDDFLVHIARTVRALSFDFTEAYAPMIDLPNFLYFLSVATDGFLKMIKFPSKKFKDSASQLVNQAQGKLPVCKPKWIGNLWHSYDHNLLDTKLTMREPTGYSIFFPDNRYIRQEVMDNFNDDELLQQYLRNWIALIKKIAGQP